MVTCFFIVGSAPKPSELTWMVFTPVPGMANLMVSAPAVALACWMAALSVHCLPNAEGFTSQATLERLASGVSDVRLTVKVLAAWADEAGMRLRAAIIAATRKPAANIFVLSLHGDFSLLDSTIISVPSLLVSLVSANWASCLVLIFLSFRRDGRCAPRLSVASGTSVGCGGGTHIVRGTYLGVPVS